jgi:hypothetical protein
MAYPFGWLSDRENLAPTSAQSPAWSRGFIVAIVHELMPWAYGLTSGAVALVVNWAIYVATAYMVRQSDEERRWLEELIVLIEGKPSAAPLTKGVRQPA